VREEEADRMPDDDLDLKMRLLRMQRRMLLEKAQKEAKPESTHPEDPEEIVRSVLRERGEEVLRAAKQQFPNETNQALRELAALVKQGEITEITGEWLYSVLNQIGIPVRLRTSIQIISDGKARSIADKMKEK
jgi:DNA-binding TFAR19-related protein (PDSD5 family)